jgi:hypothetical protein
MTTSEPSSTRFSTLRKYGAIYADPPWSFRNWSAKGTGRNAISKHLLDCYNFAVARSSLPDDLITAIADAVFSGNDELMQASHAAAETVPANFTRNTLLPFHPGAMRWYANKATAGVLYGD